MDRPDFSKIKEKLEQRLSDIDIQTPDVSKKIMIIGLIGLVVLGGIGGSAYYISQNGVPFTDNTPDADYLIDFSAFAQTTAIIDEEKVEKEITVGTNCKENSSQSFQTDENGHFEGTYYFNEGEQITWCIIDGDNKYMTTPKEKRFYNGTGLPSQLFNPTVELEFLNLNVTRVK